MAEIKAPTVRFGLRPQRGLILGLSGIRIAAVGGAAALIVGGLVAGGGAGLVATGIVWLPLLASVFITWRSRAAIEWAPALAHWVLRSANGQTRYRARIGVPRPAGTMALPGDAAALRFHVDPGSGAAMVHDPHRRTLAAVIRVSHPAYILLGPDQQQTAVGGWGRMLASLAPSGTCACIQVLESTVSDAGEAITSWYADHGSADASWAGEQYRQLLPRAGAGATTHLSTLTLSLDLRRAARAVRDAGRGVSGAASILAASMATLENGLRDVGLRSHGWLDESDLASMIIEAYDPARQRPPIRSRQLGQAGPAAIEEYWDCVRHESCWSSVLWVSQWPRFEVPAYFLHGLIFAPGIRKSVSVLARPLTTSDALRQIRREKTEMVTDAATRSKIGQIADLADSQRYADVHAREQALIFGHADMAFNGFVTVTAPTREELRGAVAQMERAATGAACELQTVYGAQAQAFVSAALPLGRMPA